MPVQGGGQRWDSIASQSQHLVLQPPAEAVHPQTQAGRRLAAVRRFRELQQVRGLQGLARLAVPSALVQSVGAWIEEDSLLRVVRSDSGQEYLKSIGLNTLVMDAYKTL